MSKKLFIITALFLLIFFMGKVRAWEQRWNGPASDEDGGNGIVIYNGNLFVTGYCSANDESNDFITLEYSLQGGPPLNAHQYWFLQSTEDVTCDDEALAIAVTSQGTIYVTGYTTAIYGTGEEAEGVEQYTTIKYSEGLGFQWARHHQRGGEDAEARATAIAVIGETCYVTGYSYKNDNENINYLTIKYLPNGTTPSGWTKDYNNGSDDFASAITIDGSGNVYVTGMSGNGTNYDYATIKYNKEGTQLWTSAARYNGSGNGIDSASSIAVDNAGNVYVTGKSWRGATGFDYLTVKYNPSGVQQWAVPYSGGYGTDVATSLKIDANSNIYVTGYSTGNGTGYDFLTVKYNSAGVQQWEQRYYGTANGDDIAVAMTLWGNEIYVTGSCTNTATGIDYTTVKYSSDGTLGGVWTYTLNGGPDYATSSAVDPNGNVYMTGSSEDDIATVQNSQNYTLDMAVLEIISPPLYVDVGSSITPQATIQNRSQTQTVSCEVKFYIGTSYLSIRQSNQLRPGQTQTIDFDNWTANPTGIYVVRCTVNLTNDENPANNRILQNVNVEGLGWNARVQFPEGTSGKKVKYGGALAYYNGYLYALKGKKTNEFYRININNPTAWTNLQEVPVNPSYPKKKVKYGGALAVSGGKIYALKGGNTCEFYEFTPSTSGGTWATKSPIPLTHSQCGSSSKKVNRGGALAAYNGYIYALKGNNTQHFFRYIISTGAWEKRKKTPEKVKDGGALVTHNDGFIYAMRGTNTRTFWKYDPTNDNWITSQPSIPLGSSSKAVKGGGALASLTTNSRIYALKGYNTNEFYSYNGSTWSTMQAMPLIYPDGRNKQKRVKWGGALAAVNGKIWALKGNNTFEVCRYTPFSNGDEPSSSYVSGGLPCQGSTESTVVDGVEGWRPQWSNDSEWILYYAQDSTDCDRIYKVQPDGTNDTCLTPDDADRECPQFSPDGSKIAYQKFDDATESYQIAYIQANGGDETVLTDGSYDCEYPRWSSDGDYIVYQKSDNTDYYQLYKISLSTQEETQLTGDCNDHEYPCFAPDGSFIVYQKQDESDFYQLYKINSDGGEEILLTSGDYEREFPAISPDGNWVVYQRLDEDGYEQIYKAASDGSGEVALTNASYDHENPDFSPDGQWVVFTLWNDSGTSQICKVSIDGGEVTALTPDDGIRDYPKVSPDGQWIVYEVTETGTGPEEGKYNRSGIYKIRLNSTGIADAALSKYIFYLHQNFPNPFQSRTTIRYSIPAQGKASLKIYDITGRQIRTLMNGIIKSGIYSAIWNGRDERGKKVASGIYFIELKADKQRMQRKILLSH